jgi:hypothetical protein
MNFSSATRAHHREKEMTRPHPNFRHARARRILRALGLACLFCCAPSLLAQEGGSATRAAEMEAARQRKASTVQPETNSRLEQRLLWVQEKRVLERFTGGIGGWRLKLGGLAAGGGFAVGPEYVRNDLQEGQVQVRAAAQLSFNGFQKFDAELTLPKLLAKRAALNVYGVHHNYPQLQYYGPGPDSRKGNRTNYRLEDTALDVTFGVQPIPRLPELTVGASTGYLWNNVGPGTNKQWASTEKVFTPAQAIGLDQQSDFFRYGGHAQFDWRDNPGGPRRGGYYLAQISRYEDRKRKLHDFTRLDLELQKYLPFFNERRVIALRARTTLTDTRAGQSVPFYLQPTLGGPDTLRGYRPFRFADNNSLLLSAEYRYEVFSGLDMAIFADAGKVTARRGQINFKNLESSVGFGFRFNARNKVFMRVETAFSHEGFQVIVRFNPVFRTGPTRTSSSQGEF